MTINYTDEELRKIEESVDKLPEHVKREVFKTPPKLELPKVKKGKVVEKKEPEESSDTGFLIPPPF